MTGSTQHSVHIRFGSDFTGYAEALAQHKNAITQEDDETLEVAYTHATADTADDALDYWELSGLLAGFDNIQTDPDESDVVESLDWSDARREKAVDEGRLAMHYSDAEDVYDELGTMESLNEGTAYTGSLAGNAGWYDTFECDNDDAPDDRFTHKRRPNQMPADFGVGEVARGRSYYALTTYATDDAWSEEWYDPDATGSAAYPGDVSNPLPSYDEVDALTLAVDLDLSDAYKCRPLPDEAKEAVEARLERWVSNFRSAFGSAADDLLMMMDSGGGTYIVLPPAVTQPIIDSFDDEMRGEVVDEMASRFRQLCGSFEEKVNSQDEYPDGLLKADKIAHKNRQFKAPASVHSSLDVVTHPIDPTDIDFDAVTVGEWSDEDTAECIEWAEDLTSSEYSEYADRLVRTLWAPYVKDEERNDDGRIPADLDWEPLINRWLEERKQEKKERQQAMKRRQDVDIEAVSGSGVVTDEDESRALIRSIDIGRVMDAFGVDYDGSSAREETDFNPFWRQSSSNRSATVLEDNTFLDKKTDVCRGVEWMAALDANIISAPGDDLSGGDYVEALDHLRQHVRDDIPVLIPDPEEYDRYPLYGLRKAAIALDVVDGEDAFETAHANNGDTYQKFATMESYNETLTALSDALDCDADALGRDYRYPEGTISAAEDTATDGGNPADSDVPEEAEYVLFDAADAEDPFRQRIEKEATPDGYGVDVDDIEYPIWGLPMGHALHIVPTMPDPTMYVVDQNWVPVWSADASLDAIENSGKRWNVADNIKESFRNFEDATDYEGELKKDIKERLGEVATDLTAHLDMEDDEMFENPVGQFLIEQSKNVVCYPSQTGDTEWHVTLKPDPRVEGIIGERTFKLDSENVTDVSGTGWFREMYVSRYTVKIEDDELSEDGLESVVDYWMDEAEIKESMEDHITEQVKSKTRSFVQSLNAIYPKTEWGKRKWDAEEPVGMYVEDYEYDGETADVVVVGASAGFDALSDKVPESFDVRHLPKTLHQEDVLMKPSKQAPRTFTSDGSRPSIYVFRAEDMGITKDDVMPDKGGQDDNSDESGGSSDGITTDVDDI